MAILGALLGIGVSNLYVLFVPALVFFGSVIPYVSILAFGVPHRLIPPPYRDGSGALRHGGAAGAEAPADDS